MYKQLRIFSTLIFVGFLMAACGSSGGGTPSPGAGSGPINPVNPGGRGTASTTHLFYKSGSISRIDPSNPSATPILVETANTGGETDIFSGTLDLTNKRITDIHTRSIVYANTDNSKLYKISALKSDSQNPVQISNESGASLVCETNEEPDFSDHEKSVFFYTLPGPDGNCSTADDILKMVRLNMNPSENPITVSPMDWETALFDDTTGAITGFIAFDGKKLVRCDQNFQNCSLIISFTTSAEELDSNAFTNNAMLRVDDKLYHYNLKTGILSSALHTFSGGVPSVINSGESATEIYFSENDTIFKLLLDGSASAVPFITESGAFISQITLTTNKVVYHTISGGSSTLKAAPKSGSTPTTLIPLTTDGLFVFEFTTGDFIFYTRSVSGGGSIRGLIKDDGTGKSEIQNAFWEGISSSRISSNGVEISRMIWAEGCGALNCSGGTLKSVDATNSGILTLGTIPSDIFFLSFFTFGGNNMLGRGPDNAGLSEDDIFYLNPSQSGSLTRITNTPDISEEVILF